MGDMADWALEQAEQYELIRLGYLDGSCCLIDKFDAGIIDELGYEIGPGYNNKWRLSYNDEIHQCEVNPPNENI